MRNELVEASSLIAEQKAASMEAKARQKALAEAIPAIKQRLASLKATLVAKAQVGGRQGRGEGDIGQRLE